MERHHDFAAHLRRVFGKIRYRYLKRVFISDLILVFLNRGQVFSLQSIETFLFEYMWSNIVCLITPVFQILKNFSPKWQRLPDFLFSLPQWIRWQAEFLSGFETTSRSRWWVRFRCSDTFSVCVWTCFFIATLPCKFVLKNNKNRINFTGIFKFTTAAARFKFKFRTQPRHNLLNKRLS